MTCRESQEQLRDLIARAHELNTRTFEESDPNELRAGLTEPLSEVVRDADRVLGALLSQYDSEGSTLPEKPEQTGDFDRRIDRVMQHPESARRIGDLCFMARLELRERTEALLNLRRDADHWIVISAAASIRRKLAKSLAAVELSLAEHEHAESLTTGVFETELERSISVRRAYTRFRHQVEAAVPDNPGSARAALRMAAVSFARLHGLDVYEYFRVEDRMLLRSLQQRLLALLREPDAGGLGAFRLYQEITAFAGLLRQVNNRSALREHDRSCAQKIADELGTALPADQVRGQLKPLFGRDDELDAVLEPANEFDVNRCRAVLERIARELGTTRAGAETSFSQGDAF